MPRADAGLALAPRGRGVMPLLLTGRSAAVSRLRSQVAAAVNASCLLFEAEPGLDIAELAADLHDRAGRLGAFVDVDCAGAEPGVVERELFGTAVASSGDLESISPRSALVRAAGGSLFLGELAELSGPAQARLARIARDGDVLVDGATVCLDVRLMASVSEHVEADVEEGRLRRDLARHFSRTRIPVAPLRQRADDIPLLVEHLIVSTAVERNVPAKAVAPPAMTLLAAMPWRRNLAELRQAVARIVETVEGEVIQLEDVLLHVRFDGTLTAAGTLEPLRLARQHFEREYVTTVLRHHRWRMGEAARTLGIQRTNLYRKARQLGIAVTRPAGRE